MAKKAKAKKAKKTAAPRPPYKCQRTLIDGECIKYGYNPRSREYDVDLGRVRCADCRYFFD